MAQGNAVCARERSGQLVWSSVSLACPFYILSSLVLAALKGLLQIKWSQLYNRVITLASFAIYATLYFGARKFLSSHYVAIIWGNYLILAILITILATRRLLRHLGANIRREPVRFFLPKGFWSFTSGLQLVSILTFLSTRLDYVFILNAGGLVEFGRYVTLITLVSVIPVFATFVLDSFLPSLTNTLALWDYESSRRLTEIYLRFMLPCGMLAATFAILFAHPLFGMLGPRYLDLKPRPTRFSDCSFAGIELVRGNYVDSHWPTVWERYCPSWKDGGVLRGLLVPVDASSPLGSDRRLGNC